jgi:hypothetical protein
MDYSEFYDTHPYVEDGDLAVLEAEKALTRIRVNPTRSRKNNRDWLNLRKYFAWKFWEVVRDTFQVTTQYTTEETRMPLRQRFRSRFPALSVCNRHYLCKCYSS